MRVNSVCTSDHEEQIDFELIYTYVESITTNANVWFRRP